MVQGLRRREAPAVAAFFERFDDEVVGLIGRVLGPADPDFLECHHTAFARALERADAVSPRRLDDWVAHIAVEAAIEVLKRRRWPWHRSRRGGPSGDAALAALPPRERAAVALFFVAGRSDLATVMGLSSSVSAKHLARGEDRLRRGRPGLDVVAWGTALRDTQDETLASIDTSPTITRLLDQDIAPPAPPRGRMRRAAMALAAVAFLGVGSWWGWPESLRFTVDGIEADVGEATSGGTVRFSDGTIVEVADDASLLVAEVRGDGASLTLGQGEAFLAVVPTEGRWEVAAGPYLVRVTGTKLQTRWDGTQLAVRVYEGSVVVTGPGIDGERRLGTEDSLAISPP